MQSDYKNTVVRITDLAVVGDQITGVTFSNCLILGPAILVPLSGTIMEHCSFRGTASEMYWPILPGRDFILGAIGIPDTRFVECVFERIGFAGDPELEATLRSIESA